MDDDERDLRVSDEEYAKLVAERGRLQWHRYPIQFEECEVRAEPGPALVIRYSQAGTAQGPNRDLAEVVVEEGDDVITVSLFERRLAGVFPDGSVMVTSLAEVYGFVEVGLSSPVGSRPVVDGTTGRPADPLVLDDADERWRYGPRGCPRWRP